MGRKVANVIFVIVIVMMVVVTFYGDHIQYRILNHQAAYLNKDGKYAQAVEKAEKAMKLGEKIMKSDEPGLISALRNLSYAKFYLERYQEAIDIAERIMKIRLKESPRDYYQLALATYNLGGCYYTIGDLERAKQFCDSANTMIKSVDEKKMDRIVYLTMRRLINNLYDGIAMQECLVKKEREKDLSTSKVLFY